MSRNVRESSWLMTVPLVVLAMFAALVAIGGEEGPLFRALHDPRNGFENNPYVDTEEVFELNVVDLQAHSTASVLGLIAAAIGAGLALAVYGLGLFGARQPAVFGPIVGFFRGGWKLDAFYRVAVVRPFEFVTFVAALFDRYVLDASLAGVCRLTVAVARFDRAFDERVVDGLVNRLAEATYATGRGLRHVQTGHLRQYVMALAAAAVVLFALAVVLIPK